MQLVNSGPFWLTHSDVWPGVKRYIDTNAKGDIIECWERNDEGIMVDVTERERAKMELVKAQEAMAKLMMEDDDDVFNS